MNRNSSDDRDAPSAASGSPELTWPAVGLGLLLAVVMGAANVYLGLRVGMTVSASIPAAVIAMAILNGLLQRRSILEANLVQTSASAGESLAAGIIFTMPALILAGVWEHFDYWTVTVVAFAGGLLGILFMIPMRRVFVVEDQELKFPEGLACAEVLRSGQRHAGTGPVETGARTIFAGLAIGAMFKFSERFLGLIQAHVEWATLRASRVFYFGSEIAPALVGVGVIVGLPIALQIFTGGAIGWLVAIPILSAGAVEGDPVDAAKGLWSSQVRYMGVGAMIVGGVVSIYKVRRGLVAAVTELFSQFRPADLREDVPASERNLGNRAILTLSALAVLLTAGLYYTLLQSAGITLLTTAAMLVMAFFLTAVASYIVGLVGNSNSPVSGMTITAVLVTGGLLLLFHWAGVIEAMGTAGMVATLGVAGIVCCVACTAGDVCNDLKTGYLIGASPRSQQLMQIGGVLVAAFVMSPVMAVLHEGSKAAGTGGIGGSELSAPQAVLFSKLVQGLFGSGDLPWNMVAIGAGIGIGLALADVLLHRAGARFRLHVMPVAVGIYLPFGLSVPILLGGVLHLALSRAGAAASGRPSAAERSVLAASGLIAGEALVGVLLAFLFYAGVESLNAAKWLGWGEGLTAAVSLAALAAVAGWILWTSVRAARTRE
ncbi:MAG TPA: oligopeptide transporter, OPT family [Planctomycetaceae bacterium]|nr:oligopeptide transporter, OPT family [Planctomycetaceae bacterium]